MKSKTLWITLLVLCGLGGLGYGRRDTIMAWYYVRQLSFAYQDNRDGWIKRVVALDAAALPRVLAGMSDSDALICDNMRMALAAFVRKWGAGDPRSHALVVRLCERYDTLGPIGREKTLYFMTAYLQQDGAKPLSPALAKEIGELLLSAERTDTLRPIALLLAAELIDCVQPGQWVDVCRGMAERGLADQRQGERVAALRLMGRTPMRKDKQLLVKAIPLLADRQAAVRRAALLALASEKELVLEEALMPLLHDDDPEVQYYCELALRHRGLTDSDLELARDISHKDPAIRMRVLHLLPSLPDLNLAEWLRQLSQDPSPAVRAAAVRAAGESRLVDMSARLRDMAANDPSETVRLNAQFYARQRAARVAQE